MKDSVHTSASADCKHW